ncbi:MAG: repair protein SbcD/Mre11 [Pseudonocardiales bacterium]|jgi:exonuclease SbcD|nr:repair protein SbcD/Mre11 [Pseudonocardiales bacterium]
MRFLHTSDWHLGRTLHGVDLLDAQRGVLAQITGLVTDPVDGRTVDAVLISGDLYDRAVPPVEAVALFADTLKDLTAHTNVIITAGNHDSAIRLGFGSELFTGRLHIRTSLATVGTPVMIGNTAVYPLPYLDPDVARAGLRTGEQLLARSHQAVMTAAMDRVRADLATRPPGTRSIVMAHAFVVGGAASESERPIVVGGVDHVSAGTFDGVDYAALGHLHGAQQPNSRSATVLRYSGSPLRYSFSERTQTKSVTLVDVPTAGPVQLNQQDLVQPRDMAEIAGSLDELLTADSLDAHVDGWVRVTVTDRSRPDQMFDRIKSRFPHVLQVFHLPAGAVEVGRSASEPAAERSPRTLAADFVRHVTGLEADGAELEAFEQAYREALADVGRL